MNQDILEQEAKEEQADRKFLLTLSVVFFTLDLFICCITLWAVSDLNPVGNLIIIH